jgi:hypothetical protein
MSKWRVQTYYDNKAEHYDDDFLRVFDTKLQAQAFRNDEQDWDLANLGEEEAAHYLYVIEEVADES